jgi:WD40 repeat protein
MHGNHHNLRYSLLSLVLMTDSVVHLVTGGDDNAIHLTEITIGESITSRCLASVLGAHTSTVTGIVSLGESKYLSVGIDQNIRVWGVNGMDLVCLREGYTFVPDVGGIVEIGVQGRKRRLVVFGTGMEMVALDES